MWEVFVGVAFVLFLLMFGGKYLTRTQSAAGDPSWIINTVDYGSVVDVSAGMECARSNEIGVGVINTPPNAILNRQNSYVIVSGGDSGTFGGSRIQTRYFGDSCFALFNANQVICYKGVLGVQFDGRMPRGGVNCQVSYHLDFTSQSIPTTSTTMMLDRPPPAKLDVFGILFKLIEDIGKWVKSLFGFSTYAFQKQVIVDAGSAYTKTFTFNMQGIPRANCYDPVVYQAGNCNYLNKCYMVMPKGCTDLSCAAKKDCVDITATAQATETLGVTYTPTQLNSEYAVVAFIAESDMVYVASSKTWSENTFIVESTKQSDVITVPGAGVPPAAKGIVELFTQFLLDIINFIKGLFGG